MASQPISEDSLLTDTLEQQMSHMLLLKLLGSRCVMHTEINMVLFISVMPTNMYGPNDNYDLATSHVLPALIRKFHEAKQNNLKSVTIWGDGLQCVSLCM